MGAITSPLTRRATEDNQTVSRFSRAKIRAKVCLLVHIGVMSHEGFMKSVKVASIIGVAAVACFIIWDIFANAVNSHMDQAAATIIESNAVDNVLYSLNELDLISGLLKSGNPEQASIKLKEMTDDYIFMLEQCSLKKCVEAIEKYAE